MTHVYVIQAEGGPVRVGITINLPARLQSLRSAVPLPLRVAYAEEVDCPQRAAAIERTAHVLLRDAQMNGGWFNVSADAARAAVREATEDPHRLSRAGATRANQGAILRKAREACGWSVAEMAGRLSVTVDTVRAAENGRGYDMMRTRMKAAIEAASVEFIEPDNKDGPGM